jgi:hypothetical protein
LSAVLTGTFAGPIPNAFSAQGVDHVAIRLTNTGDALAAGNAKISLYASTEPIFNADATLLASSTKSVRLRPRQSAPVLVKFPAPTSLPNGSYFLIARVDAPATPDGTVAETIVTAPHPVSIPQPFVDLSGRIVTQPGAIAVTASRNAAGGAGVLVLNSGNIAARGPLDIQVFASADNTLDSADTPIASVHFKNVNIRANGARLFAIRLSVPGSTPVGSYTLFASINTANTIAETTLANNIVSAPRPLVLVNPPTLIDLRDHHHNQDQNDGGSIDIEVGTDTGDDTYDNTYDTSDDGSDEPVPPAPDTGPTDTAPSDSGDDTGSDFVDDTGDDSGGGADF